MVLRGQSPEDLTVTALPVVTESAWEERVIGVTVIVVFSPLASTIGLALISVDLLPSAPSNYVVSTVAVIDPHINLPNFLALENPAKPKTPS